MNVATPPIFKKKKSYGTRKLFRNIAALIANSCVYVKRTYQEGRHLRNYLRGLRQCQTRKPYRTILKEMYQVTRKWKTLPLNYFKNALYDQRTPYAEQFLAFIPEPVLFTRYMPILSPTKYRILMHNNYFFNQLLRSYDIDSPSIVLWSFARTIYGENGAILNDDELTRELAVHVGETLVLKSQHGSSGNAIKFVSVVRGDNTLQLEAGNGVSYGYAELRAAYNLLGDWQLEEAVRQHPLVSAIYPHSINWVRIVTLTYPDGEIQILAALMHMGRSGSIINNACAGGIHVHIDINTGEFLNRAYSKTDNATYTVHPDTGHPFPGVVLPFWNEIVSIAKRGAALFMQTHTIAWDIAIGEVGPIVIKGNPTWNPGTMERGSFPKGDRIIAAAAAWQATQKRVGWRCSK